MENKREQVYSAPYINELAIRLSHERQFNYVRLAKVSSSIKFSSTHFVILVPLHDLTWDIYK